MFIGLVVVFFFSEEICIHTHTCKAIVCYYRARPLLINDDDDNDDRDADVLMIMRM